MNTFSKSQIKELPTQTGVYLMRNQEEEIIYVGKAKNLRSRIRSYYSGQDKRHTVQFLVKKINSIETILTDTEEQALILERDLINKHKPRYNIRLKDDKNYLSIRIDDSAEWPRLELVRRVDDDGAKYFGPFSYGNELRELLEIINQTIPLRTCSDNVFHNRVRPCLEHQIKRCAGPCCLDVDPLEYRDWVKQAMKILNGKTGLIIKDLEKQMQFFSDNLHYEDAANCRDRIELLKNFKQGQKYISSDTINQDVFYLYREDSLASLAILQVRNGRIANNKNYSFDMVQLPDEDVLQTVLEQYYLKSEDLPQEIIVSTEPSESEFLSKNFKITYPQRGLKMRLLKLAELNARKHFETKFLAESNLQKVTTKLAKTCALAQTPRRIECIDISNLQGSNIVGGLVCFFDGKPDKSNYKRYKISFQDKPNDFKAIYEVVKKRLQHAKVHNDFPDLLVIDGGAMQLDSALRAMEEHKLQIDIIALAKKRGAKQERIFLANQKLPIILKPGEALTSFLARIRDEAHRFVITYHRHKRTQRVLGSALDSVPGIGPKRKKKLLQTYSGIQEIQQADPKELAYTVNIPLGVARNLIKELKKDAS